MMNTFMKLGVIIATLLWGLNIGISIADGSTYIKNNHIDSDIHYVSVLGKEFKFDLRKEKRYNFGLEDILGDLRDVLN